MDTMDLRHGGSATTASENADADHADIAPRDSRPFLFERFFEGKVRGWGYFEDRFRKVRSRFHIEMSGRWVDDLFVLDEVLRLDNGDVQERRWRVTVLRDGRYRAQVDDVVGVASGESVDDGVKWSYRIKVPVGGKSIVLTFDDHMRAPDGEGPVLNVAVAKKWGVTVGRLIASYRRA